MKNYSLMTDDEYEAHDEALFNHDEREGMGEELARILYRRKLHAHPVCADPEHPGCVHCKDPQDEDDEGDES